jgi:hypothetical protein
VARIGKHALEGELVSIVGCAHGDVMHHARAQTAGCSIWLRDDIDHAADGTRLVNRDESLATIL